MSGTGVAIALSFAVVFGIVFDNTLLGIIIALPFLFAFGKDEED